MTEVIKTDSFFGHPVGLSTLFLTEMWERFSYYGMRALLILYLTKHFLFGDARAGMIYGSYVALIYGLPLLGGIVADRYLGIKKAVTFGAILLVIGHISMALEGEQAYISNDKIIRSDFHLSIFFLSISFIAVGVGFLKANISNLVGSLYSKNDPKRDSGFTIFYMGINLGAFTATLVCAYLGETYGWKYGFGVAGLGMFFGLMIFRRGLNNLRDIGLPPDPEHLKKKYFGICVENIIYVSSLFFIFLIWFLFRNIGDFGLILAILGGSVLSWLGYYLFKNCNSVERKQTFMMLVLMAFSIFFWALFEQAASSVTLFTDRNVDFGDTLSAGMIQALNPLFIVIFAPVFAWLWVFLGKRNIDPHPGYKFGIAILLVGLGFFSLVIGKDFSGDSFKVPLLFLAAMYLFHTFGELCLSPVGLSMVTKLSIPRIAGFMMGVWFLSSSLAGYVSGIIASSMAISKKSLESIENPSATLNNYIANFEALSTLSLAFGLFLLILTPIMKKYLKA